MVLAMLPFFINSDRECEIHILKMNGFLIQLFGEEDGQTEEILWKYMPRE